MTRSAKHYVFTINNYTDDDKERLGALFAQSVGVAERPAYCVYGEEVGDEGTHHLQGYISFKSRKTFRQAKDAIGTRAHVEVAKGSPRQAAEYCKKDGSYTEFGELPGGPGRRNDLGELHSLVSSGASVNAIQQQFPGLWYRYRSSILATRAEYTQHRIWPTTNIIYWGRTGAGKTRKVYDTHDFSAIYTHSGDKWFDGYDGHEIVLFDDYNGSEFKLTYLLKLLDRYPMRVEVKGGFVQWVPKTIYFTSNKDPHEWYANARQEHVDAFFRRINTIDHFD